MRKIGRYTKMRDYIPDPIELYNEYDAIRQRELESLPRCSNCGKPITGSYSTHDGEIFCNFCYSMNFDEEIEE